MQAFIFIFFAINPGVFVWMLLGLGNGAMFSGVCLVVAVLSIIFPSRPPYTRKGLSAENKVQGLCQYIATAEKNRIEVLNRYQATPDLYEKFLPIAMIFNLEQKWSEAFEGIAVSLPETIVVKDQKNFSPRSFSSDMRRLSSSAGLLGAPKSSSSRGGSSSGGSSGGGGGGGGGGSW